MGALVTLELPEDSPIRSMPWIITFGPLSDDEDWEPVVCGPYERPHALALAEEVVADDELMAVVEPLSPFISPGEIRSEIAAAKVAGADDDLDDDADLAYDGDGDADTGPADGSAADEPDAVPLPAPDEVKAGMVRIGHSLVAGASH